MISDLINVTPLESFRKHPAAQYANVVSRSTRRGSPPNLGISPLLFGVTEADVIPPSSLPSQFSPSLHSITLDEEEEEEEEEEEREREREREERDSYESVHRVGVQVLNERRKKKLAMIKFKEKRDATGEEAVTRSLRESDPSVMAHMRTSPDPSTISNLGEPTSRMGGGMKVTNFDFLCRSFVTLFLFPALIAREHTPDGSEADPGGSDATSS